MKKPAKKNDKQKPAWSDSALQKARELFEDRDGRPYNDDEVVAALYENVDVALKEYRDIKERERKIMKSVYNRRRYHSAADCGYGKHVEIVDGMHNVSQITEEGLTLGKKSIEDVLLNYMKMCLNNMRNVEAKGKLYYAVLYETYFAAKIEESETLRLEAVLNRLQKSAPDVYVSDAVDRSTYYRWLHEAKKVYATYLFGAGGNALHYLLDCGIKKEKERTRA